MYLNDNKKRYDVQSLNYSDTLLGDGEDYYYILSWNCWYTSMIYTKIYIYILLLYESIVSNWTHLSYTIAFCYS